MTYLSWGAFYEGESDAAYFGVLIPRIIQEIILVRGTRHADVPADPALRLRRGSVDDVAREACDARRAFHIAFFHADTGGAGQAQTLHARSSAYCEAMSRLCCWPPVRCIAITPRHETEAWILADPAAVASALGYIGPIAAIGLPSNAREAERLSDPKAVLQEVMERVRGRRRPQNARQIASAIAQRQSFDALRQAKSFIGFEQGLLAALADLGCIPPP